MAKINEGFADIKDKAKSIFSTVDFLLNGEKNDKASNYLGGSISQYSKNLVMTFPVLCDNTLSPETASMISKANERNVTTMLQLLFSAMNIEANDGMKVISQIHKNISTSMDVYEVIDKMNDISGRMAQTSGMYETVKGDYGKYSDCVHEMVQEVKYNKSKSYPINNFSESSLNRFTITKRYNGIIINEQREMSNAEMEKFVDQIYRQVQHMMVIKYTDPSKEGNKKYYEFINSQDFVDSINVLIDQLKINNVEITDTQRKEIENEIKNRLSNQNTQLQNFEMIKNNVPKLVDTDVKKANELQPTVLQINYSEKKENGDVELRTFLAGVKSRLIAVDSKDIVERIIAKNKTKINFLNFIRATSGEIGFFKDFLFAIDQAKLDSKNAVKKGEAAALWNCLSSRAAKNSKNRLNKLGNDASAITVLVVSQETVNYMKSVHKFDLEKLSNTKMICEVYNFMGIMIADESIEVLKTFYVGNNSYETTAYSFLEKQERNSDYKKMVSLMGKMNTR